MGFPTVTIHEDRTNTYDGDPRTGQRYSIPPLDWLLALDTGTYALVDADLLTRDNIASAMKTARGRRAANGEVYTDFGTLADAVLAAIGAQTINTEHRLRTDEETDDVSEGVCVTCGWWCCQIHNGDGLVGESPDPTPTDHTNYNTGESCDCDAPAFHSPDQTPLEWYEGRAKGRQEERERFRADIEALRRLADDWEKRAHAPGDGDYWLGREAAYEGASEELHTLLDAVLNLAAREEN